MTDDQTGRTITEIRVREDAQASDFRLALPATAEAVKNGCTLPTATGMADDCHRSDCPLHVGSKQTKQG